MVSNIHCIIIVSLLGNFLFCMQKFDHSNIHHILENKVIDNECINVEKACLIYEILAQQSTNLSYACDNPECPTKNPGCQEQYKNKTISMLEVIAKNNDGLVNWTIFASGGLKPEFNILNQFFALYPTARVWIDCIDIDYSFLVEHLHNTKSYDYCCFANNILLSIDQNHQCINDSDVKYQYLKALNFLYIIKEYIRSITQHYPKASLYIKPFSSVKEYTQSCDRKELPVADLISGTDFTDADSIADGSMQDYQDLILYAQNNNPSSKNIALIALLDSNNNFSPTLVEITNN